MRHQARFEMQSLLMYLLDNKQASCINESGLLTAIIRSTLKIVLSFSFWKVS
jgi:prophage antirepressor-like protein